MIRKITVKTLKNYDKDKEGNPLTGKFGTYYKYGLTCDEYPTKTLYGIGNKALGWKAGEQYDIDLEEKGEWLNFKLPKKEVLAEEKIQELEKRIKKLEDLIAYKLAEMKSDLALELTGKVQTDKDFKEYSKPHPMEPEIDGIPLDAYKDEPEF